MFTRQPLFRRLPCLPSPHVTHLDRRSFLKAAEIEAAMPRLAADSLAGAAHPADQPQLVPVAPGHLVEAIVTH